MSIEKGVLAVMGIVFIICGIEYYLIRARLNYESRKSQDQQRFNDPRKNI